MDTRPPRTKNLSVPDEILSLEKGSASTVRLGELVVGRLVLEPGWRWSEHVRPIAGTTSCQFHHVGLALSGAMDGRMDDGTEFEVRPAVRPGQFKVPESDAFAVASPAQDGCLPVLFAGRSRPGPAWLGR